MAGTFPIGDSSEAREAQVIDSIYRNGDWLMPRRNGVVPSKPPLHHWIGAGAAWVVGGASEGVARFPSVLAGTLLLLITMLWCERLAAGLAPGGRPAVLCGFVLLGSYGFTRMVMEARVDMLMSFLVVAALAALLWRSIPRMAGQAELPHESDFASFFGICGLAVLAKGPLGIALPVLMGITGHLVLFGPGRTAKLWVRPRWGWLLFLALVFPYYWVAAQRASGDAVSSSFVGRQIIFENLTRFLGGEHIESKPWWFYGPHLVRQALPWIVLALMGFWSAWRGNWLGANSKLSLRVLSACIAAGLCLFSLSVGKRASYLLPLMPLVAISATLYLLERWNLMAAGSRLRWAALLWPGRTLIALALLLSAWGPELVFSVVELRHGLVWQRSMAYLIEHAAVLQLLSGAALLLLLLAQLYPRISCLAGWTAVWVLIGVWMAFGRGIKADLKHFEPMARIILAQASATETIWVVKDSFDEYFDPLLYYLKREARLVKPTSVEIPVGALVVVRAAWLVESGKQDRFAIVAKMSPLPDMESGAGTRDIVLCRTLDAIDYRRHQS